MAFVIVAVSARKNIPPSTCGCRAGERQNKLDRSNLVRIQIIYCEVFTVGDESLLRVRHAKLTLICQSSECIAGCYIHINTIHAKCK